MLIGHESCGNANMKLSKSMLHGAILLALALGSASASAADVSMSYGVDADHDGRTDHTLELEQSDSLA
jgi:hypothetical protein